MGVLTLSDFLALSMWLSAPSNGMEPRTPHSSTWHSDLPEGEPVLSLGTAHSGLWGQGQPMASSLWQLTPSCSSFHQHPTLPPTHSWKLRVHSEKPVTGVHQGHLERVLLGWLWTGSSAVKLSSALESHLCRCPWLREGRWPLGWDSSSGDGTRKDQRPTWSRGRLS